MNDYSSLDKTTILIKCLGKMYKPCLFSALTTIFAFATLYTSEIKPVMDFGLMMCVGLMITYLTSLTFLPAIIAKFSLKKLDFTQIKVKKNIFLILTTRFSRAFNFIIYFNIIIRDLWNNYFKGRK
jgi:Predicted exporters of the RND superfamily